MFDVTPKPADATEERAPALRVLSWEAAVIEAGQHHPRLVEADDWSGLFDVVAATYPRHIVEDMARDMLQLRFRSLFMDYRQRAARRGKAHEERIAVKGRAARAATLIVEAVETRMLELVLGNGKALGDCTGPELRAEGGWLRVVAKRVLPGKIARDCLTSAQLEAMRR